MGLPEGLLNYIRSLYEDNVCIYRGGDSDRTLYKIESGIIQGCPLSGSIFVLTVDPFLQLLKRTIPSATNRAFADDIATLVQSLQDLPTLKRSFDLFRDISGLDLKVKKCSLIPLGINPTPDAIKRVTRAVRKITPEWANFSVVPSAEYLGVMIGPKGGSAASWEKPLKKFIERTNLIANAALAPSIGTDLYTQRVVPTMGYIAQIACTTPKIWNAEKWALQRITHIPHNAFPRNTFFYQHEIGMRNITPLGISARAALIRTAKITCTWRHEWSELQKTRNEKGPMTNLAIRADLPGKDNSWWAEPAYADNLSEACKSVPNNTWRTILKCSPKRTRSTQAAISKWLRKTTLTNNLANTIGPRISRFFPNANKTPTSKTILHDQLKKTINIAKTATPAVATSVLRTWCNAWITARRTQSQIGRCRFGCTQEGSRDELEHYIKCKSLLAPINGIILQKTGLILGSSPGEFLTFCPPHLRSAECPNPRANLCRSSCSSSGSRNCTQGPTGSSLVAKRAARIIRLHIANDVYQSLGNPFSAGHSNPDVSICSPSLTMEKIVEASRKLSENLNWHTWVTSWNPPPGNLCHESTGVGNFDANPRVKLLPKTKGRPLDTSGLSRRNPRAKVDPSSPTQIWQGTQDMASVTEASDVAPSPTSAGAAHSQTNPLGRCNLNNPPLPTMFDAKVHVSSQITQLETYVLPRHEVSLWRDLSAYTPVFYLYPFDRSSYMFDAKAHESIQICQLEAYVLTQYGVSSWRNMDMVVPVCPSGHALNHIQITGLNNAPRPSGHALTTSCCVCNKPLEVHSHAYSCFRCVSAYFCKLPVDKVIVSAGLSKGTLFCTKCAFHSESVDKMPVQHTAALLAV